MKKLILTLIAFGSLISSEVSAAVRRVIVRRTVSVPVKRQVVVRRYLAPRLIVAQRLVKRKAVKHKPNAKVTKTVVLSKPNKVVVVRRRKLDNATRFAMMFGFGIGR